MNASMYISIQIYHSTFTLVLLYPHLSLCVNKLFIHVSWLLKLSIHINIFDHGHSYHLCKNAFALLFEQNIELFNRFLAHLSQRLMDEQIVYQ